MSNGTDVQVGLTAITAGFDAPMKTSAGVATATGNAIEKAAKKAAQAQAFAAKFAADTVSEQSLKIIAARKSEMAASAEYRKALSLEKAGLLDTAQSAQVTAAALQRLQASQLATAAATKVSTGDLRRASTREC